MFLKDLGCFKSPEIRLALDSVATPKFYKARPVPYHLRDKCDTEIDKLLTDGIMESVKFSSWAAVCVSFKKVGHVELLKKQLI